jgi:hypothetical protein
MACEKLYIWIVKRMKILMNNLNLYSLASDQGISGIMPFKGVRDRWSLKGTTFWGRLTQTEYIFNKHAIRTRKSIIIKVFELFYYVGKQEVEWTGLSPQGRAINSLICPPASGR